jgi:hypothetical protein
MKICCNERCKELYDDIFTLHVICCPIFNEMLINRGYSCWLDKDIKDLYFSNGEYREYEVYERTNNNGQ